MKITQEKLAELKERAEKGDLCRTCDWDCYPIDGINHNNQEYVVMDMRESGCGDVCYTHDFEIAKYIVAANPATILALIAEIEQLRKEKNDLKAKIGCKTARINALEKDVENLRKEWREPFISKYMQTLRMAPDALYEIIKKQDREIARLEREAEQLAKYLADNTVEGKYEDAVAYWRETARAASEEAKHES